MKCNNISQVYIHISSIWAYNENEIVFVLALENSNTDDEFVFCLYKNKEIYKPLLLCKDPSLFNHGWVRASGSDYGRCFIYALPGRKIMYFTTEDDYYVSDSEAYYTLHIMSIDTGEETTFKQKYIPIRYPDPGAIEDFYKKSYGKRYNDVLIKNFVKAKIEFCVNREYIPSVHHITYDGNYIFVFQKRQYREDEIFRVKDNYDVDVIDMNTLHYIKTVTFPKIYRSIRNGYVYLFDTDKDGFPVVNKYKIDPSVYGK